MTLRYLVDTDWVIDHLHGHSGITERLVRYKASGVALSIISVAELLEGVLHSPRPKHDEHALDQFLSGVTILEIDRAVCRIFAAERGRLRKARNIIGDFDLMIGATALRHGLTVLTNNRRHFERIKGLEIESA